MMVYTMFRYLIGEGRRIKFKASLSYMKSYLKKQRKREYIVGPPKCSQAWLFL